MNDSAMKDSIELEIRNFGPIFDARVDLRSLTVFMGPGNTGKSYLAMLVYALHRHFSADGLSFKHPRRFHIDDTTLSEDAIDDLFDFAEQLVVNGEISSFEENIVLPDPVLEVIRPGFEEQGGLLGDEICRCFGVEEPGALIRKGSQGAAEIVFRTQNAGNPSPINHRLTIKADSSEFSTILPESIRIRVGDASSQTGDLHSIATEMMNMDVIYDDRTQNISLGAFLDILTHHACAQIVDPLDSLAYYLPADRTGAMHVHSVGVSTLIESAAMTGLRPALHMPMFSGVLADFLEQFIKLGRSPYRRRKRRYDLGRKIEKAILGGSVRVDKSEAIGYPHFTYKPKGWKSRLSLMNASSMVSELAPVVLYLRHLVRPGNVLIVEEPESHLHPAMQVEFTRQLAALVCAGIRVIVTTHSEWMLEELANIVRRSGISKSRRKKMGNDRVALRPDQVGAWLFKQKKRPKGTVVEEMKLNDETGLYPSDFDAVSEELYNESVNIFRHTPYGNTG